MLKLRVGGAAASLVLVSLLVMRASNAAFFSVAENPGNQFTTGDVTLVDDDNSFAMFSVANMKPGQTEQACINVTYKGAFDARVVLYGALRTPAGLETYLDVTVERSTGAAGGDTAECLGFVEAGKTTSYTGTLGQLLSTATNYSTGVDPWTATGDTTDDTFSYRFTVTLQNNDAAQGKGATVDFIWEAQAA